MKATTGKRKSLRGRVVCHTATIGPFVGQGKTSALAIEAVEASVRSGLARLERGACVRYFRGHVAVIAPSVGGWSYWIDTFSSEPTQEVGGQGSSDRERACGIALHHLAQCVWDPSIDDAEFVASLPADVAAELSRWILFQRSYASLREQGKNDADAHRLACSEVQS